VQQQQAAHLIARQQSMLAALVSGNAPLLAQLSRAQPSAPPQEQPLAAPIRGEVLAALPCRAEFAGLVSAYVSSQRGHFTHPTWGPPGEAK
jgi:hypothetical protein